MVASDKEKTPSKVDKIASSVGAKIYEPDEDLDQDRKKELGEGDNSHERDASAAAFNAYRNLKRERQKIERFNDDLELERSEIAHRFFQGEKIEPERDEENKKEEEGETGEPGDPDREKLRMERKIERLEKEMDRLKSELGEKDSKIETLESRLQEVKDEDRSEILKEEEIRKRESMIDDRNEEIERLEDDLEKARVRNRQYRKALEKLDEGYELVPFVNRRTDEMPEKAVTRSEELRDELSGKGFDVRHVEELEGVELGRYMAVKDFPDKSFRKIIEDYRESR